MTAPPNPDDAERSAVLDRHILGLSKQFDVVLILGTYMDEKGDTRLMRCGHGNFYARMEICRMFLRNEEHDELAHKLARAIEKVLGPDDDDPEPEEAD